MRILMTTDTVGGVWSFTKELAGELLRDGCAVALISLGRKPSQAQQAWADAQQRQSGSRFCFEGLDTPLEWMAQNDDAFAGAAPVLSRVAEDFEADLLLTSQYCFGALAVDIPRIVVAHSDVLSWANACRSEGLQDSAWLRTYCELVSRGLDGADAVVAPTHWMLNALASSFRLPRERRVIPNGRTLPCPAEGSARKMQAVTGGRLWDEAKNLQMLEDVDSPMPLLIAGEREYGSAHLEFRGEAKLLGTVSNAALMELFEESAIYICTSKYEPFGLAPLEAALCGCAVLANDIDSLHEVWGDAALYFSGTESLSEWLLRLNDHKGLLQTSQARAMSRAREFSAERMARGYLELFRSTSRSAGEEIAAGRYVA
jgi:glycogen synthase